MTKGTLASHQAKKPETQKTGNLKRERFGVLDRVVVSQQLYPG